MGNCCASSKSSTNEGQKQSKKEGGRFFRKKSRSNSNPKTDSKKKNKPQKDKSQAAKAAHNNEVDLAEALKNAMELNMAHTKKIKEWKQYAATLEKNHQRREGMEDKHWEEENNSREDYYKSLQPELVKAREDLKAWRIIGVNLRSNYANPAPNHFMKHETEHLVEQMEAMKEQIKQQDRNMQATNKILGEVQTQCDFFREELQQRTQLPTTYVENEYLRELLKQMEHEKVTFGKCKLPMNTI